MLFSLLNRNEILTPAMACMNTEHIMLNVVNQSQQDKYRMIPLTKYSM